MAPCRDCFVPTTVGAHRDEDALGGIGCIPCPSIGLTNVSTYLVVYHLHNFFYPDVHRDEETLYDIGYVFSASDRRVRVCYYLSSQFLHILFV